MLIRMVIFLLMSLIYMLKKMAYLELLPALYWIVVFTWGFACAVIFWCILSYRWKQIPPIFINAIRTGMMFHPIPGHSRYMDLKFSLLRHAVAFIVAAVLIYYVKNKFAQQMILFFCLLYADSRVYTYIERKKHLTTIDKASCEIYSITVYDSFYVVVYSILCVVFLYILYGIRP